MAAVEPFIAYLAQSALLDAKMLARVRAQVASAKGTISAEKLAKALVSSGHLTSQQAKQALNDCQEPPPPAKANPTAPDLAATQQEYTLEAEEQKSAKRTADEDLADLMLFDDEPGGGAALPPQPDAAIAPTKKPSGKSSGKGGSPWKTVEKPSAAPAPVKLPPAPVDEEIDLFGNDPLPPGDPSDEGASGQGKSAWAAAGNAASTAAAEGAKKKSKNKNKWDSSLIYMGGGGLAVLVFAFVMLYITLARGSASEALAAAEADFTAGDYPQAIVKYQKYVEQYPSDANVSLARVRIGIGQIRQAIAENRDWQATLESIGTTLQAIEAEPRFEDVRSDLADILPNVASDIAEQARRSTADVPQATLLADQAEQALALLNRGAYIPSGARAVVQAKATATLQVVSAVKRELSRDADLKKALAEMEVATTGGKTAQSLETRRTLLRNHPGLLARVSEATAAVVKKQQSLVKVINEARQPAALPLAVAGEVALADRSGQDAPSAAGKTVAIMLDGAVYCCDVATGRLLWRTFVGLGSAAQPIPLTKQGVADWLAIDQAAHALVRIQGSDGSVLWRLPIGEAFGAPQLIGERILVTTAAGLVWEINAATGAAARHVVLGQRASAGVGYSPSRPQLYQLGQQATLFVLAAESLECRETYFVGHEIGSIAVPPVMVTGQLFVAENAGADYANIHILATDAEGLNIARKQPPVRLEGHVVVPPVVDGKRIYFFTNLGGVQVFDVDAANTSQPVTSLASMVASLKQPVIGYPTVADGKVWIAGQRLTQYELQPARQELARRWSRFDGDAMLAPAQLLGSSIIHARLRRGTGDCIVSASNAADGATQWQTSVQVPVLAVAPAADNRVLALNSSGVAFVLPAKPAGSSVSEAVSGRFPTLASPPRWTASLPLPDDRFVLASPHPEAQWALATPEGQVAAVKWTGEAAALVANPAAFASGLLLPLSNGQLALADVATGKEMLFPFQPRQEVGTSTAWLSPLPLEGSSQQFVVADRAQNVYLVGIKPDPKPHLSLLKQIHVDGEIVGSLAQVGDQLVALLKRSGETRLQTFALADLSAGKATMLAGGVQLVPATGANVLLALSDAEGLVCIDAALSKRWAVPLAGADLVGSPLRAGGDWLLVTTRGEVWRVAGETGEVKKKVATGRPLGGTPVFSGGIFHFPGMDGAVYSLPAAAFEG